MAAKFSVSYYLYDANGNILYDGDVVKKYWGGGSDDQGPYREYEYHRLSVSKRGRLRISGCENIVHTTELVKVDLTMKTWFLGKRLKERNGR